MRIFVTGAAGFVGRLFCQRALAHGDTVVASDRRDLPFRDPRLHTVIKDMRELTAADLDRADAVVHFATGKTHFLAGAGDPDEQYRAVLDETVAGTRHVCAIAKAAGVRRVVHISSMTVYPGPIPRNVGPGRAAFDPHPERRGIYAHSKILAEAEVQELSRRELRSMEVDILRLALVCGPGMGNDEPASLDYQRVLKCTLISTGKPVSLGVVVGIGSPGDGAPVVDIRDLLNGILTLVEQEPTAGALRIWDVQSIRAPRKRELIRAYAAAAGRPYRQAWLPRIPTLAAAWAAEGVFRLKGKREHFPYRIGRAYRFDARVLSHTAFWQDIGMTPQGTLSGCLDVATMRSLPEETRGVLAEAGA